MPVTDEVSHRANQYDEMNESGSNKGLNMAEARTKIGALSSLRTS
jgi:hypothetical protein